MILSMETIYARQPLTPLVPKGYQNGLSYGLSSASYDVRIDQNLILWPGRFALASTMEMFNMPLDLAAVVMDKSTNARRGLCCQNTFVDPGFRGWLTIELTNHSWRFIRLVKGDAIAQIVFHQLDHPTKGYAGKYQNQQRGAQFPRFS
jgi:dCTP deaminase